MTNIVKNFRRYSATLAHSNKFAHEHIEFVAVSTSHAHAVADMIADKENARTISVRLVGLVPEHRLTPEMRRLNQLLSR